MSNTSTALANTSDPMMQLIQIGIIIPRTALDWLDRTKDFCTCTDLLTNGQAP